MTAQAAPVQAPVRIQPQPSSTTAGGVLQRKCACGNHTVAGGECEECEKKKNTLQRKASQQSALDGSFALAAKPIIQRKLSIGSSDDPLEHEADRVADQVLAAPANPAISGAAPHIQRITGQATTQAGTAPAYVDRVLTSPGRPLDPTLRQDMEHRFGHDFSMVRVHSGSMAEQSAQDVNANAYTVGHNIVFGPGQFTPETHTGRWLLAHELTHTIQQNSASGNLNRGAGTVQFYATGHGLLQREERTPVRVMERRVPIASGGGSATGESVPGKLKVGFVHTEAGLKLREGPDTKTRSLATLKFGQRLYVLEDSIPGGWLKVAVSGQTGYVAAMYVHFPPEHLVQQDPGLSLIRVKPGQTFWGLVKEVYGIQGNESTKDQNINHFINAIRAFNKEKAFKIEEDTLDKIGNATIPGRDASDTYLIAGVDLWIPSFGVAAKMDVGSGTVRGEITRLIKKIDQKLSDFKEAALLSVSYMPGAIKKHIGEMAAGLIDGLIDFAKDAAKILAISTAVGALIGALFGGVGALPGAEIGFEIGLVILEYYGLFMLIEAILGVAGGLLSALGEFISLVWTANGDREQLKKAGMKLADALGILVSAVLVVLVAYLLKKGTDFIKKTKFGQTVGESRLAKWLEERQKQTTTKEAQERRTTQTEKGPIKDEIKVKKKFEEFSRACTLGSINCRSKLPDPILKEAGPYPKPKGFNVPMPSGPFTVLKSELSGVSRATETLKKIARDNRKDWPEFDKALSKAEAKGLDWVYDSKGNPWEVHHNKPVSMGGGNNPGNLIPLPRDVHLEFSKYWGRVHKAFRSRFTSAEWDLIYQDVKSIAGSKVPKKPL